MDRRTADKLNFFLKGLEERLKGNWDYLKKITALYKSGAKDYEAVIIPEGEKLRMSFYGRNELLEKDELARTLTEYSRAYEAVTVIVEERGTVLCIEADNKDVKMKTRDNVMGDASPFHCEKLPGGEREYYIKIGQADELLKEIGILTREGKIRNDMVRKYNQIDHFVELIDDLLKSLAELHRSITVLDCGCGKSYLTFVLNYYIREVLRKPCHFIGLDSSPQVIEASRKMAQNLGYRNMEFEVTDIKGYRVTGKIHLVISLHACDTATDEAMALAVNNNVHSMVMVPCCHRELLSSYSYPPFHKILKHGILKARMADVLTDGMRALLLEALGYKVSIVEYVSPLDSPKNLMIRAEKVQGPNREALQAYEELKKALNLKQGLALERLITAAGAVRG